MGHILLLASLCVALVVCFGAFLTPRREVRPGPAPSPPPPTPLAPLHPAERFAVVLPLLGFLATLPTHKPFAVGQGLGLGFLIGGVGAVLLFLMALRGRMAGLGSAGLALVTLTVTLPLLLLRPVLIDALMGVAIGWFATTFLFTRTRRSIDGESQILPELIAAMGFAAILSSAAILATLRDPKTPEMLKGTWSAIAVAFASALSLLSYIVVLVRGGSSAQAESRRAKFFSALALGVAIVTGLLLGTKGAGGMRLFSTLTVGLIAAPLILWLRSGERRSGSPSAPDLVATRFAGGSDLLAVLIIVSGFTVGGQLLLGYGSALFLAAFWAATVILAQRPGAEDLRLLLFGSILVLYRAYLAGPTADLHGVNLSDQYALFGFVVGAACPSLIATIADGVRLGSAKSGRPIVESFVACLLTLATPAAVILIFGPKCLLALILGSAVGSVFASFTGTGKRTLTPGLLALAMALAVNQFGGLVQPYADLSRLLKLKVLAVVIACLLATVAVAAWKGRRRDGDNGTADSDGSSDTAEAAA